MKAIETSYAGYKFRSRLEARWAVFFDAMELDWNYEPEGFVLKEGLWYLPDFYLPQVETWIEVKPEEYSYEEKYKCMLLCVGTGTHVILLNGVPDFKRYLGYYPGKSDNRVFELSYSLMRCNPDSTRFSPSFGHNAGEISPSSSWPRQYRHAVCEARSARFEHGDNYD